MILAAEQRSLSHCSIHLQTKDFARRTMYLRYIIPVYRYIRHGLSRLKTIFSLATLSFQTPAGRETLRLRLAGMVTPQCYSTFAASLHVLYHPSVTRRETAGMLGNILIPPAHALPILVLMRPDYDTNFAFAFLAFAQHASTTCFVTREKKHRGESQ